MNVDPTMVRVAFVLLAVFAPAVALPAGYTARVAAGFMMPVLSLANTAFSGSARTSCCHVPEVREFVRTLPDLWDSVRER